MNTASAVLRVGAHAPVLLHGAPAVSPDYQPGETVIILGWTSDGQIVTITARTLEWANDLLNTTARGMARAETPLAVRP